MLHLDKKALELISDTLIDRMRNLNEYKRILSITAQEAVQVDLEEVQKVHSMICAAMGE